MSKPGPGQRTLQECRRLGWRAQMVEKWVPQAGRRIDLFGFGDVLAVHPEGILLIQATTQANAASRVTKITQECAQAALDWIEAGGEIEVWGWAKRGPAGRRKLWTVRRQAVTAEMLETPAT